MTRSIIALPLLVAAGFGLAAPAVAADDDGRCTALPAAIKAALPQAYGKAAQQAQRRLANGVLLCEAGNERAAAKEFRIAARQLGIDDSGQASGATQVAAAGNRR